MLCALQNDEMILVVQLVVNALPFSCKNLPTYSVQELEFRLGLVHFSMVFPCHHNCKVELVVVYWFLLVNIALNKDVSCCLLHELGQATAICYIHH